MIWAPGCGAGLSLATGQSVTMMPFGTIDPNATGLLTNTVTVAAPLGVTDTNAVNNTATDIDTLTPPTADLSVTMTDGLTTWTILNSIYARARRRPCVTMFGLGHQGRG